MDNSGFAPHAMELNTTSWTLSWTTSKNQPVDFVVNYVGCD